MGSILYTILIADLAAAGAAYPALRAALETFSHNGANSSSFVMRYDRSA